MPPCVMTETIRRSSLLPVVVLVSLLVNQRPASAQGTPAPTCAVPNFPEEVCPNNDGSIDSYKRCYRDLYDLSVIPGFRSMADCTHSKAVHGIRGVLEGAATRTLMWTQLALDTIASTIGPGSGASTCIGNLNAIEQTLRPYIEAERDAPNIDAYRRATYTPALLTYFTNVLLSARQNRADCDQPLRSVRRSLVQLGDLKISHPDYCEILRESADYSQVSSIGALGGWTAVDPDIDFNEHFDLEISISSQCGYYDFSNGQASIEHTTCGQLTSQYSATLGGMDGALGWIADNRELIVASSTAAAITILSAAGYGSSAGPYGTAIGVAVGLVITGVTYIVLQREVDSLYDLIEDKERELRDVVAEHMITSEEFDALIEERCPGWQAVVEQRFDVMLRDFDGPTYVARIDGFFTLSDRLHDWYNELILWATTPGPNGQRFISELARQELLARKQAFDEQIFAARADQEIAAVRNQLNGAKSQAALLGCANLSPSRRREVKGKLNVAANLFSATCSAAMSAIAMAPGQPLAFADSTTERTVECAYEGFRHGVAAIEIVDGSGFTSNIIVKDGAGNVIARLNNVSSDTDFAEAGLAGFHCWSVLGGDFGKSATTRLAPATYALRLQDNLLGVDESDANLLRSAVQTLDSQFRLKQSVCLRQMGGTIDIPRTAEACGLPVVQ